MKTILFIILIIIGGIITILNASIPFRYYILKQKEKSFSCIPVIGGLLLFVGLLLSSNTIIRHFSFLALIIDIGCLPMVAVALYKLVKGDHRGSEGFDDGKSDVRSNNSSDGK